MPISKSTLEEMKKYNFHTISDNDTEGKMCATCDYGTSLMGGTPAYCYKTGLRIDWDFICNQYKEKKTDPCLTCPYHFDGYCHNCTHEGCEKEIS